MRLCLRAKLSQGLTKNRLAYYLPSNQLETPALNLLWYVETQYQGGEDAQVLCRRMWAEEYLDMIRK